MKHLQILEAGDVVKIKMQVSKVYFEDGDVRYTLSDPRRMGRPMDYPFTNDDLELVVEDEVHGS